MKYKSTITKMIRGIRDVELGMAQNIVQKELYNIFKDKLVESGLFANTEERDRYLHESWERLVGTEGVQAEWPERKDQLIHDQSRLSFRIITASILEEVDAAIADYEAFIADAFPVTEGELIFRIRKQMEEQATRSREHDKRMEGQPAERRKDSDRPPREGRVLQFDPTKGKRK